MKPRVVLGHFETSLGNLSRIDVLNVLHLRVLKCDLIAVSNRKKRLNTFPVIPTFTAEMHTKLNINPKRLNHSVSKA